MVQCSGKRGASPQENAVYYIQDTLNYFRIEATLGSTDVYIDINKSGAVVGGTFKPDSEPGKLFAETALTQLCRSSLL